MPGIDPEKKKQMIAQLSAQGHDFLKKKPPPPHPNRPAKPQRPVRTGVGNLWKITDKAEFDNYINSTYNKICLMLPTYKRTKEYLPKFISTAEKNVSDPDNICFAFCVNKADIETLQFIEKYEFKSSYRIIMEDTKSPHLSKYFNMLYDTVIKENPNLIVSMLGDDMEFHTKNYDLRIIEEVNKYKGFGVFYCRAAKQGHIALCVNLFVTKKMVDATGESFMCEKFKAELIDYLWHQVGRLSKSIHYLNDVLIYHNHSGFKGPTGWDETFKRLMPVQQMAHTEFGEQFAMRLAKKIVARMDQE